MNFKILVLEEFFTMASGEERPIPKFFENNGLAVFMEVKRHTRRRFYRSFLCRLHSYLTG